MAQAFREIKTETGNFMRVNIFPVRQYQYGRKQKSKPTAAAQKKLNQERRARMLSDIINLNFTAKDKQIKLDYAIFREKYGRNPTPDEVVREMRKFLRRLKRECAKLGVDLKYVYSSEVGSRGHKSHHHMVLNVPFSIDEIKRIWGNGGVWMRKLYFDRRGCYDLSGYFVKNKYTYRSYTCSKNLKRPQEGREIRKTDYRIRQKQVNYFTNGDIEEIAKLYPGWEIAELPTIAHTLDENTGELRLPKWGVFITLYLYKPAGLSDAAGLYGKYKEISEWRNEDVTEKCL